MVLVIAHRTCFLHEAENSLAGIVRAGSLGAGGVEIDVRATRDGVPVLVHDRTLQRLACWPLPTRCFTLARLRRMRRRDNGLQIPTLAEALAALPGGMTMAIDVKEARAALPTITEVRRQDAEDRVLLWAKSRTAVRIFARELPNTERALLRDTRTEWATRRFLDDAVACNAHAISAHWNRITPDFLAEAQGRGLQVYAMAQNADSQASRLEAGLDGVVTNWPVEALALLRDGRA